MKYFFIITIISFLVLPVLTWAVGAEDVACDNYNYPWCKTPPKDIADFIKQFYTYALAAVGVAALGAIIYGGVMYAVSAGNASRQQEAISWITGAVWGLVLLLGANLLLRTINPRLKVLELSKLQKVEIKQIDMPSTALYKTVPSTQTLLEASETYNSRKSELEKQGLSEEKVAETLSKEIAIGAQCKIYKNRESDCIKFGEELFSQYYNQTTRRVDYDGFESAVNKKLMETGKWRLF